MPSTASPSSPASPGRLRRVVRRLVRPVALAVAVVFAVSFVVTSWDGIVGGLERLRFGGVLASLAFVVVGLVAAMLSYRAILGGLGSVLPPTAAARVYFLGQLGKYVPGSVWPILAQAELSKEHGVPASRAGFAAVTQMLVGLVVGVVVAGASLAVSSTEALRTYWWLGLVAAIGVVALTPAIFNWWVAILLRLVRRANGIEKVTTRSMLATSAWCAVMWLAFGAHLWMLAGAIGADGDRLFLLSTGGYALAWVVGFVIVILPAGAGAREAALVLVLGTAMGRDDALTLALVSRFLMLLGDAACAAAAVVAQRRRGHHGSLVPAVAAADPEV